MTLLARIQVHSQQICGLAWSPDGKQFATGGNDNLCCLFSVDNILHAETEHDDVEVTVSAAHDYQLPTLTTLAPPLSANRGPESGLEPRSALDPEASVFNPVSLRLTPNVPWSRLPAGSVIFPERAIVDEHETGNSQHEGVSPPVLPPTPPAPSVKTWQSSVVLQTWHHLAAVKAIAFCPWRPHLIATSGGSNDKMIHFFHTTSGAALTTIAVSAQVTSLTWSTTRREIAATFGYAQPDHAVRIAVFSWPDCKMVGHVKWDGEHRALFAVPYPGGPASNLMETDSTLATSGTPASGTSTNAGHGAEVPAIISAKSRKQKKRVEGCLIIAASDESIKFHEV
jgi:meiosis-specific APC/C activator protein AMA1